MSPRQTLSTRTMNTVKSYASKLVDLPPPEHGEWTKNDLPAHLQERFRFFETRNIIDQAKSRTDPDGPTWTTPLAVWDALEDLGAFDDSDDALPCGHIGIRNPRDKPGYECRTCGEYFTVENLPPSFRDLVTDSPTA